ncbi:MAG: response regulator [Verrucomicrobiota bacterium]|nr:response regulator [Verrucomicrobiota bacterium]
MSAIYILCLEDEPEVLDNVVRDLSEFEDTFPIEAAGSVQEARKIVADLTVRGDRVGVILCDHIMPGEDGVSFLVELADREETVATRKILLTAQAGLESTIEAINKAHLHYYVAKPWKKAELVQIVKAQMTEYVLGQESDIRPFLGVLDSERLASAIRQKGLLTDE